MLVNEREGARIPLSQKITEILNFQENIWLQAKGKF